MSDFINQIEKLSPSKIQHITDCQLRFILESKEFYTPRKRTFNKFSFLGNLIHAVLESYIKKKWSLDQYDIEWEKCFIQELCSCGLNLSDQETVKYHLPYYIIKKKKLEYLLRKLNLWNVPFVESEYLIESSKIYGVADIVELDFDKRIVRISDLKSGVIFNVIDGIINDVKSGYRLQLLSYGLPFFEKGFLPENIVLRIIGLNDNEDYYESFTSKDFSDHSLYLKQLIEQINSSIRNGNLDDLANPNDNTCLYCDNSNNCIKLHKSIEGGFIEIGSMIVISEINVEFDDLNSKININTNGELKSIDRIPLHEYIDAKTMIESGKKLFVKGLYEVKNSNVRYWTRYSLFLEANT